MWEVEGGECGGVGGMGVVGMGVVGVGGWYSQHQWAHPLMPQGSSGQVLTICIKEKKKGLLLKKQRILTYISFSVLFSVSINIS